MSYSYISTKLRKLIADRANDCCEYCLQPESLSFVSHQADHIISEKHGGETTENNLAFACILCNKYKGSDIATLDQETGEITALFSPRKDSWSKHFQINNEGFFSSTTAIGRGTIRLLKLNQIERIEERKLMIAHNFIKNIPD